MDDIDAKLDSFINQHLPQCVENVERLAGGLINYTFRLHLKETLPPIPLGKSTDYCVLEGIHRYKPRSLIAKAALPYIAALGEDAPLTVRRQKSEERALKLFTESPLVQNGDDSTFANLSTVFHHNKTIRVARAWLHDEANSILLMDDLGAFPTMEQWCISKQDLDATDSKLALAQTYGEQVADFIIQIQIASLPVVDQLEPLFYIPELKENDLELTVAAIQKLCATYEIPNADHMCSVYARLFQHDLSRAPTGGQVFAHGDLWPPNFLIDEHNATLALIDWELAGIQSPAWDLGFLFARYHVDTLINSPNEYLDKFMNTFADFYRESAEQHAVSWYSNEDERHSFAWHLAVVYGVVIMFWTLSQKCCPELNGICDHRHKIAAAGAQYVSLCDLDPNKAIYDSMVNEKLIGRLFRAPN